MANVNELSTRYDASAVEQKWYAEWEKAGLFQPDEDPNKPVYCITIPPPNITGSLHMGHALCYSIHDMLGRYNRQVGKSVLILPGQDHAGIATQSVVDKMLRKEGSSAAKIGREAFIEKVWEWRHESGNTIINQFRRMGCAFDWSRLRFTLDEKYVEAVLKVFIEWFEKGLIYKGKRVVNWDPSLQTSVSDIEIERQLIKGKLYHIRYPFADGSGEVVIATTRPETMLADVAVAVHPDDKRYVGQVGKTLILPLLNREIPLIADTYPDPEFGTGAVKITPAHDPNDYEVGVRHSLEMPVVLDERGKINENGGQYAGLDRQEARKRIVADLEEQGYLVKIEDHEIAIQISDRSKDIIEPLLSEQWFVSQTKLAEAAIEAVKSGRTRFIPNRYEKVYLEWMENIRDWCISRQLWWGHRIPVYYTESGEAVAAHSWEEAEKKSGQKIVKQDDDVLDTWFSSGLWPFATLGWPEETADLKRFYPTDVLITARDIIYLWVARMIMMGEDFMGKEPFKDVFIYATILTEDGKRMSKSLGTGVDPMDIIEKLGADALRWTLFSQTGYNQEIRYSERRTEDARNFCNKVWNATRFVLMNVPESPSKPEKLEATDQWLLSRLYATEKACKEAYESYNVQEACSALYKFFWSELADWYIEVSKARLAAGDAAPRWVLITALSAFFKLLHPLMPHISEELYQFLPTDGKKRFLMEESWPGLPAEFHQPKVEAEIERAFEITRAFRALRAELGLTPMKALDEAFYEGDLGSGAYIVQTQSWVTNLMPGKPAEGKFVSTTVEGVDLHIAIGDLVDPAKELERLDKESEKISGELEKLMQRLNNADFVSRAKPEIVERDRALAEEMKSKIEKIAERRKLFAG